MTITHNGRLARLLPSAVNNNAAIFWDIDQTARSGYFFDDMFPALSVLTGRPLNGVKWVQELNAIQDLARSHDTRLIDLDLLAAQHFVRFAQEHGITNDHLLEAGKSLQLADGFLELNARLKVEAASQGINLEIYVVSGAYRRFLQGSELGGRTILVDGRPVPLIDAIWGVELGSESGADDDVISKVSYVVRTADKGEIVRKVAIGSNVILDRKASDVPEEDLRVPYRHMVFVGDGISDERGWEVVRSGGGLAIAVYYTRGRGFAKAQKYRQRGYVDEFARADFRQEGPLEDLLMQRIYQMSAAVEQRERELATRSVAVFGGHDSARSADTQVHPIRLASVGFLDARSRGQTDCVDALTVLRYFRQERVVWAVDGATGDSLRATTIPAKFTYVVPMDATGQNDFALRRAVARLRNISGARTYENVDLYVRPGEPQIVDTEFGSIELVRSALTLAAFDSERRIDPDIKIGAFDLHVVPDQVLEGPPWPTSPNGVSTVPFEPDP